jgi:thiopeptide-type bacteriocin biosynthesis protein
MHPTFRQQFIAEYGEEALHDKYGPEGLIPYFSNNSIAAIAYVPEYNRYGGRQGVELAERYFEVSSDFALHHLASPNGSDAGVLLGHAFRFFVYCCQVFLDKSQLQPFCETYYRQWSSAAQITGKDFEAGLERKYARQRHSLEKALAHCWHVAHHPDGDSLDHRWVQILLRYKKEFDELDVTSAGTGVVQRIENTGRYQYLLPSYIHMHNNRLGLAVSDEPYIAYLAGRLFKEHERVAA